MQLKQLKKRITTIKGRYCFGQRNRLSTGRGNEQRRTLETSFFTTGQVGGDVCLHRYPVPGRSLYLSVPTHLRRPLGLGRTFRKTTLGTTRRTGWTTTRAER